MPLRLGCLLTLAVACVIATPTQADQPVSYTRDVRPILSENCFYCHGQDANKRMADLQLNTAQGQAESGVIVAGDPASSELIRRVMSSDGDLRMPPIDSNRQLTEQQKQTLQEWVRQGAEFEQHWAFQRLAQPEVPEIDGQQLSNPIDALVRAKLRDENLQRSPPAKRRTLIRRLSLDLTGLPPSPQDVEAFVADESPDAYEKVVDRLLASPHYGERMALPWLDAARFADSNGFQQDGDTFQWVWRDWVVRALNDNMPFDQFTIEQLAGDLLPEATQDQRVATAFLRNHMLNGEGGAIPEEQRYVVLVDRVNTISTNWLGLTMACAQCHDHKYDPITMQDFYSLMDALDNIPETGVVRGNGHNVRLAEPILDVATPEQKQHLQNLETTLAELKQRQDDVAENEQVLQDWIASISDDEDFPDAEIRELAQQKVGDQRGDRDNKLKRYFADHVAAKMKENLAAEIAATQRRIDVYRNDSYPRVMVMEESKPRETFIYDRGNYLSPGEKVTFATPAFLPPLPDDAPRDRLGLARWLMSDENPLTARVIVNRQWELFFGQGLVSTNEDFGVQSEMPVHRELLDWLACEFRQSGWDIKRLHRLIVTSETYRQSSQVSPEQLAADPANRFYARQSRFRLSSLLLRDQALAASGLLNRQIGGRPVYPYQQPDPWASLAITKERNFDYPASGGDDLYRRSLYTFWRRTVAPDNMFDEADRKICSVGRSRTNTPLHALTTLNDPTYVEAARTLAQNAMQTAKDDIPAQIAFCYRQLLCREPTAEELPRMSKSFRVYRDLYAADGEAARRLLSVGESARNRDLDLAHHAAMTATCLTLLNLDETLTRE